jgi:subtilase family serine protease
MLFPKRLSIPRTSTRQSASASGRLRRRNRRESRAVEQTVCCGLSVESLEDRVLLSATIVATSILKSMPTYVIAPHTSASATPAVGPGTVAPIDPAQMQVAYGINKISFNGIAGTGAGQTVAIVDAYDDPNIIGDTATFDTQWGLPQFNVGGPTLQVLGQTGTSTVPTVQGQGWDLEESLDVQWVHSMAPQANIILFEANSNSFDDLGTAEQTAAGFAGVSVVSNSWGGGEDPSETGLDSLFTTPGTHQGVTFLASTGDNGTPAGYPSFSPNVVAVGGTNLQIDTSGNYLSESVWNTNNVGGNGGEATGGGISTVESIPSYQSSIAGINNASTTMRNVPDVAADADPATGVWVRDTFGGSGGWWQVGGTSLACPLWGGMIAIANQGRTLAGEGTLNGATQTLPMLYQLPSSDFHDITVGSNGSYSAGPGYDLVSGRGTPIANLLVPALAGYGTVAPSVSAPSSVTVAENGSVTLSGANQITLTDAFSAGAADTMTLSVSHGTLNLGSTTGLSLTGGAYGSATFTVSGTIANLNADLSGLVYTPTALYVGSDTLSSSLTDPGESLTGTGSTSITVTALTAPIISAPSTASLNENGSLTFSSANSNAISFTDTSAGTSGSDSLTLSVLHGTLTLGSTTGLTFTGTNGTASFSVTGTVANLNAALSGLVYQPTALYIGSDSLSVGVTDSGDSQSSSKSVALTINALSPPAITAPSAASVNENTSLTFSSANGNAISISDAGSAGNPDSFTLSVSHGTLTLASTTGLSFTTGSNGSSSFTVSGTVANFNAALNGLKYTPTANYVGSDMLAISVTDSTDGQSGSGSVALTVKATTPPAITAPSSASVNENASLSFTGGNQISFTDVSAGSGTDSLTLSVTHGTLGLASVTGLTFTAGANHSASFTVTGTVTNLNAALSGLSYQPTLGYSGPDSLSILVNDPATTLSASTSVALTVNPVTPPVITAPGFATLLENSSVSFSTANGTAISFTDAVAGSSTDSVTLIVSHGKLTLSQTTGLTFTAGANNSASFTINGTVANLNAALNGLTYTPTIGYSGSDSLAITVADSGDSQSSSANVALTVTAVPSITVPPAQSVAMNGDLQFNVANGNAITLVDGSAGTGTQQLTLIATHGILTLGSTTGITFTGGANSTASMTLKGTLASLNAALSGLQFIPTTGYTGAASISLSYVDLANNLTATGNIVITVTSNSGGGGGGGKGPKFPGPGPGPGPGPSVVSSKPVSPPVSTTSSTVGGTGTTSSSSVDDQDQWEGFSQAVLVLGH